MTTPHPAPGTPGTPPHPAPGTPTAPAAPPRPAARPHRTAEEIHP
ncbi:hypothetical protein ACFWUW_19650 [Streptomyces sp. NPDC058655]